MFDERYDLCLYTLEYHVHVQIPVYGKRFGTLSVFESSPHEYVTVLIKQARAHRKTLQRRQRRMNETISVMEKSYEMALSYLKHENDGKLGRGDGRLTGI